MDEPILPTGKVCNECGKWKLYEEFHRCKEGKAGRYPKCKECRSAIAVERGYKTPAQYRGENRERMRARDRERYHEDLEASRAKQREQRQKHKEKRNAESRARYQREIEARRAYARSYQKEHREQRAAYLREYKEANRDKVAFYRQNRAHRKRANGGDGITREQWTSLCAQYGNRCLACGSGGKLQMDHVIPLSRGGAHDIKNVQPLCPTCNRVKNTKSTDYRNSA